MKSIDINLKFWLFRWIRVSAPNAFERWIRRPDHDICSLTSLVIRILLVQLTFVAICVVVPVGMVIDNTAVFTERWPNIPIWVILTLWVIGFWSVMVASTVAVFFLAYLWVVKCVPAIKNLFRGKPELDKEPTAIAAMASSVKNKLCYKVNIKDD